MGWIKAIAAGALAIGVILLTLGILSLWRCKPTHPEPSRCRARSAGCLGHVFLGQFTGGDARQPDSRRQLVHLHTGSSVQPLPGPAQAATRAAHELIMTTTATQAA